MAAILDTPEQIAVFHMMQLRSALRLEVGSGLKISRGSVMKQVNKEYGTKFTKKKDALEFMNAKLAEIGF
jgi:hypothetical protein